MSMTLIVASRDVATERAAIDADVAGRTFVGAFAETVDRLADTNAIRWKRQGVWQALTWREYRQQVSEVALGLASLGLEPGQFTVIMARNRPEPMIADLATQHARGVPVFLYNTLAAEQVGYIAGHCAARVAIVEDRQFLKLLQSVRRELPHLQHVVLIDGEPAAEDAGWTMTWQDLRAAGRQVMADAPQRLDASRRQVGPEDLATVMYTSGTTGQPKGVMISQRNVLWQAGAAGRFNPPRQTERTISYLPLAHATGRWVDLWSHAVYGGTVHCCSDATQLFQYAAEVHPTVMVGVPRVWEKLHTALLAGIAAEPDSARRQMVEGAIQIGRQAARLQQRGVAVPAELAARVAQVAPIHGAILARVGLDECDRAFTGAAPIDPDIIEFFQAIGLPMTEAWGMTELTCAATGTPVGAARNGSIGLAGAGVEMRLANDGEILVRCGSVMRGYYKDAEATASAIDPDGWLHTGDLGAVDADGYYSVIGRKKDIIITAGGKNIAPAGIENLLQQHPLIGQTCVIGDRRPYITALLVLDAEGAPAWARQHQIEAGTLAELAEHPLVLAEIERAVEASNQHLSHVEQVKRYRLVAREWTAQSGELTPTLKRRRSVILERYAAEIDGLYSARN
jgi:long-chain acyl-CoA synthetase